MRCSPARGIDHALLRAGARRARDAGRLGYPDLSSASSPADDDGLITMCRSNGRGTAATTDASR